MKFLSIFVLIFSLNSFGQKNSDELYADCKNYCAFSEFEDNCHGIAFKKAKDGKTEYLYTHHSKTFNACVYFETYTVPIFKKIALDDVKKLCQCNEPYRNVPDHNAPMTFSTRQDLMQLKAQIESWARCAPDPLTIAVIPGIEGQYRPSDLGVCKEMRAQGTNPYIVLGGCQEGTYFNQCNYYGNTNNFVGPFCMAGDSAACADLKKNQDPQTGAWYRSAYQRRFPFSETGQPLFSRDEYLGMMMYFATTKDKDSARKWLTFLKNNPKKYLTGTGKLIKVHNICPPHPGGKPSHVTDQQWKKMQADDRCELRPNSWGELYRVYRYIGFSDRELKAIDKGIYRKMKLAKNLVKITNLVSSNTVPRFSYETGLQAASIQLFRYIGYGGKQLDLAAKIIDKRTDFMSPYYHFLAKKRPTEFGAYLIKKYCSATRPNYAKPPQGGIGTAAASYFDSAVHFYGGLEDNWEANLSTGHDCIGWINLYLSGS